MYKRQKLDRAGLTALIDGQGWRLRAILCSHAHFDHADGFGDFFAINDHAPLLIRSSCEETCWSDAKGDMKYIGIQRGLLEQQALRIERVDGTWLVDGSTPVDDIEREFGIESMPEEETYETVSGFIMYMLRRVPKRGDFVEYAGYRFEVTNMDGFHIDQVLYRGDLRPNSARRGSIRSSDHYPLTVIFSY